MNAEKVQQTSRPRRVLPSLNFSRIAVMLVMITLMIGQAEIMRELGVWGEAKDMYQLSIWFAFAYGFMPQIRFAFHSALGKFVTYLEGRETDTEGNSE